jgi:hypothetical protein
MRSADIGEFQDDLLVGAKAIAEALNWKNARGAWHTRRVYHLAGEGKLPFHKVPGLGLVCRKTTLDSYFRSLDERFLRSLEPDSFNK